MSKRGLCSWVGRVLVACAVVGAAFLSFSADPAHANGPGAIRPPFPVGQTWYVCQGYNQPNISHGGYAAFDLIYSKAGIGPTGCNEVGGTSGKRVDAPGSGKVAWIDPQYGDVCINLTGGGSIEVAHINYTVAVEAPVAAGQQIGTVAAPGTRGNGGVSHIHLQAHKNTGCTSNDLVDTVPFTSATGFRICGSPDFPYSGAVNQWRTQAISGSTCATATVPSAPRSVKVTSSSATATVSWTTPSSTGGASITSYEVVASPSGRTCTTNGSGRSCTVTGLTNGMRYQFSVRAKNSVGWSPKTWSGYVIPLLPAGSVVGAPESVGLVDGSTGIWYLLDGPSAETTSFYFGSPGDFPFMGDWNCDGIDTPGLYRQSDGYVYLRNSNSQGVADISFYFGDPGDVPIAGDFNANGCDTVSIYRPSDARFFIVNKLGKNGGGLGPAEYAFSFGNTGDKPFAGDFNGTGQDTIGLHRESTGLVYFRNTTTSGIADKQFYFGDPGDKVVAGRWWIDDSRGPDTVGVYRPSTRDFYLKFDNVQGNANAVTRYGNGIMAAVSGRFGDLPGGDDPPPWWVGPFAPPPVPSDLTFVESEGSGSSCYDERAHYFQCTLDFIVRHDGPSTDKLWGVRLPAGLAPEPEPGLRSGGYFNNDSHLDPVSRYTEQWVVNEEWCMWVWTRRHYDDGSDGGLFIDSEIKGPVCAVIDPYGRLVEPGSASTPAPPTAIEFSRQEPSAELTGSIDMWFNVTIPDVAAGAHLCFDIYLHQYDGFFLPQYGWCYEISGWTRGTYELMTLAQADRRASFSAYIVGFGANSPKTGPVSGTPTLGGWVPG